MGALCGEEIEHTQQVSAEIGEIERPLVVVALPVAAGVPGGGVEVAAEGPQLVVPVGAITANTVQADHQRTAAYVWSTAILGAGRTSSVFQFVIGCTSRAISFRHSPKRSKSFRCARLTV
jgi:hypothetical protein